MAAATRHSVEDQFAYSVREHFEEFLREFSSEETGGGVSSTDPEAPGRDYIEQCKVMKNDDRTTLFVDYMHVEHHNADLAKAVAQDFYYLEPFLRKALENVAKQEHPGYYTEDKEFFVSFFNMSSLLCVRDLKSDKVAKLVSFSGTVTRTSEVRPELIAGVFQCDLCGTLSDPVHQQFKYCEPTKCKNATCVNRTAWKLITNAGISTFVDWQKIRVQENATEIPAGSMPRTLDAILRGDIVERAKAGDKCIFTGTLIVIPDVSQLATPGERVEVVSKVDTRNPTEGVGGLKALGCRQLTYRLSFLASSVQPAEQRSGLVSIRDDSEENVIESFTAAEKDTIERMKMSPRIYDKLANSIAPTIYGHEQIKQGILLMLFGGVHKSSAKEGIKLRGDINCCLVGDPSTAKSNFLKYVCSILPRTVYTSGKASTAAGLTATVCKDQETGEFCIEAGALMLADNGICCIDEFDKMDQKDQVAIHEAMEQQTISIAKAGIQATLNARASILAAANPQDGRYDRRKNLRQNLNLSSAIMSRFDLFFVMLDDQDERTDFAIAKHIVKLHQHRSVVNTENTPEYTTSELQRYIRFARTLKPMLSAEASRKLVEYYKELRRADYSDANSGSYRVTVRQLEAMIRLGEARARVELEETITVKHIQEAKRLLKQSIVHVDHEDVDFVENDDFDDELERAAEAAEQQMREEAQAQQQQEQSAEGGVGESETQSGGNRLEGASRAATVSNEKYQKVARSIAVYIRSHEKLEANKEGEDMGAGLEQGDVINWYLNQQDELSTMEALAAERKLVRRIITRLIKTDKTLIVVQEAPEPEDGSRPSPDMRIISVNPNFVVSQ